MHLLTLFFAVDGSHAKKRILAFKKNVDHLTIVSYYRNTNIKYDNHYNLGKSSQKQYFKRFIKILFDVPRLVKILNKNSDVNVVYAWNFDMALLFTFARVFIKRKLTFIYEVADIKPILISTSVIGKLLRYFEQKILNNTDYLCVTSQQFITNYFDKYYIYNLTEHILENKVYPQFPLINDTNTDNILKNKSKWTIGLVGLHRCKTSLQLLNDLATHLPNKIDIYLAGIPEKHTISDFDKLNELPNVYNFGKFNYPEDLRNIYSKIDIIWSADFSDLNENSKWLLPNRIYEAGCFSVPQLSFSENETTSEYIKSLGIGWVLSNYSLESIITFINRLNITDYNKIVSRYKDLSPKQFSGDDQIISLLNNFK